jgi:hypothetical protein
MVIIRFFVVSIFVFFYQSIAFGIECPQFPAQVSNNSEIEVKAEVAKIGPVKGAELATKTKNVTLDLMNKLPGADKLYLQQMMLACYCSSLRDDKSLSESDKREQLKEYLGNVSGVLRDSTSGRYYIIAWSVESVTEAETKVRQARELGYPKAYYLLKPVSKKIAVVLEDGITKEKTPYAIRAAIKRGLPKDTYRWPMDYVTGGNIPE